MALLKIAAHWHFACHRAAMKLRSFIFLNSTSSSPFSSSSSSSSSRWHHLQSPVSECSLQGREGQTLVVDDFHGALLRTSSVFPFFMLVAFEGGSLPRAALLLLLSPFLWLLGDRHPLALRIMVFVTFCGLRRADVDLVSRAVLPKFYLESLRGPVFELLAAANGRRAVFTSLPRVIVEGFLRECLAVDEVVAAELQVVRGCYFTGLVTAPAAGARALGDLFGDAKADVALVSSSSSLHDRLLFASFSEEIYMVNEEEECGREEELPRNNYPKPLIFHDGRLAFLPTPASTLALFMWISMAFPLSVFRITIGLLPYKLVVLLAAFAGIRLRVAVHDLARHRRKGALYVCTHRTLLDPVALCTALQRPVPVVTYSLSRMSELISPIKTVRLSRDRARDAATMRRLLADGELAVCPEGTTCREPYLLRFSSLFAELTDDIVPVALEASGAMFYGTTASGHKWLDPVVFGMNPVPDYRVQILAPVPAEMTRAGGLSAVEVANGIQRLLAEALGFECTSLTRRDKYLMLVGNEGFVN